MADTVLACAIWGKGAPNVVNGDSLVLTFGPFAPGRRLDALRVVLGADQSSASTPSDNFAMDVRFANSPPKSFAEFQKLPSLFGDDGSFWPLLFVAVGRVDVPLCREFSESERYVCARFLNQGQSTFGVSVFPVFCDDDGDSLPTHGFIAPPRPDPVVP